jgi:hypothetical protein
MPILGHIRGAGAIVGGKSELLGVREAVSVGGLFIFGSFTVVAVAAPS